MPRSSRAKTELTQNKILDYIKEYIKERGFSPSLREIQDHIGFASPSNVKYHIDRMIQKGVLSGESSIARSLTVIEDTDTRDEDVAGTSALDEEEYLIPTVWVVRARGYEKEWSLNFVSQGYVGIDWGMDEVNMSMMTGSDEIESAYRKLHPTINDNRAIGAIVGQIRNFISDMKKGDYIITPSADDQLLYYGRVTEQNASYSEMSPYRNRREMHWSTTQLQRTNLPSFSWNRRTISEIKGQNQRNEFFTLIGRPDLVEAVTSVEPEKTPIREGSYTIRSMLQEDVFLRESELQRMLSALQSKKNLILQGPPGVGKTFIARKLAYVLMGEKADARIISVQFHQSYSYEDFVGGLRPDVSDDQQLIFTPQDGTFLKLCDRARNDSDSKYVMLIDEVNRGNLSRVFGELLMLIEADKRTEDNAIELQHQRNTHGDADNNDDDGKANKFFVPENVYIIGTMNLADRSLTGMNIAMRRRFRFIELSAQFGERRFRSWLARTPMPVRIQERIHSRMRALNEVIYEDISLGKDYAVGHSFFCPSEEVTDWEEWYKRVVDYEIRPLLEEYWFDDQKKAGEQADSLLKE